MLVLVGWMALVLVRHGREIGLHSVPPFEIAAGLRIVARPFAMEQKEEMDVIHQGTETAIILMMYVFPFLLVLVTRFLFLLGIRPRDRALISTCFTLKLALILVLIPP